MTRQRTRLRVPIASSSPHAFPRKAQMRLIRNTKMAKPGCRTVRDRLNKHWPGCSEEDATNIGVLCISLYRKLYPKYDPMKRQEGGQQVFAYPGKFIRPMDGLIFNYYRRKKANAGRLTKKYSKKYNHAAR